jgi:hypothetical protein
MPTQQAAYAIYPGRNDEEHGLMVRGKTDVPGNICFCTRPTMNRATLSADLTGLSAARVFPPPSE